MLVYCQSFDFVYTLPSKKNQNWYISKNNFGLDSTACLEKNPQNTRKAHKANLGTRDSDFFSFGQDAM